MGIFSNIEMKCECCGNKLSIKSSRDLTRKRFCSIFCRNSQTSKIKWENEEYREKMSQKLSGPNPKKGRHGRRVEVNQKCLNCDNIINKTNSEIRTGHKKYCCKECKVSYLLLNKRPSKKVKVTCNCCGIDYMVTPNRVKTTKYCSYSCLGEMNLKNSTKVETDIEKIIRGILEKNNIKFDYQFSISNISRPDFLIFPNILIYADGDYWHSKPHVIERDIKITNKLKNIGYEVLRFNGNLIKKETDRVEKIILEYANK
jgi:very-short-patch-repair endonuclease